MMSADSSRNRHGGAVSSATITATDNASPTVIDTFLAAAPKLGNRKRKGFTICRCAQGGALLPFPAGR